MCAANPKAKGLKEKYEPRKVKKPLKAKKHNALR